MICRLRIARLLLVLASGAFAASAVSQDYPSKPVRLIVPSNPGVPMDMVARSIAPSMTKAWGQPIIVENKPGANLVIGMEYVVRQPADGYHLLLVAVGSLATLPVSVKDLRFDPLKDLPPVIGLAEDRYTFGSSSSLQWKTFQELVAHAKANPGKLNFGASNNSVRMLAEAVTRGTGMNVTYIPYSQASAYLTAMVSGEVHMGVLPTAVVIPWGDKFRVLAVSGSTRQPPFMHVPTFAELGMPQIPGTSYSINVAAGTPKAVVDKVYAAGTYALQQQEVRDQFVKMNMVIVPETSEAAAKKLADEARFYSDIARRIGLSPQ